MKQAVAKKDEAMKSLRTQHDVCFTLTTNICHHGDCYYGYFILIAGCTKKGRSSWDAAGATKARIT